MNLYQIRQELKNKSINDIPLKVTYYARVSTDKYEQLNSLDNQISFFEDKIKENKNWIFVEGYIDEGISGTSTDKRDAFQKMIKDAEQGKFNLILTKEVSRFARDTLDSIEYTRKLLSYNVGVNFTSDNINTLDEENEFKLTIFASMSQEEVRKLSQRCKFGFQRSIKSGRVLGNDDIWGYRKNNCKLEIIEEEAVMIERIFELYSFGKYGCRTISNMLFSEGFKNKNGKPLSMTTIANIIRNPKYKGYYCGNKSVVVDYKLKTVVKKDKEDWVIYKDYDTIPPIVSEELWDLANKIYEERSKSKSHIDKKIYQSRYYLSGKLECNHHHRSFHRKIYKYKTKDDEIVWLCPCNNGNKTEKCKTPVLYEKELLKILKNTLYDFIQNRKSIVYNLTKMYRENYSLRDFDLEISKLSSNISKIKKEKDKLLNLNIKEMITDIEFKERNDDCNARITVIEEQISAVLEEKKKADNIDTEIAKLENIIEEKTKQPSDEMIFDLLDKIVVYNTENKESVKLGIYLKIGEELTTDYYLKKSHQFDTHVSYD